MSDANFDDFLDAIRVDLTNTEARFTECDNAALRRVYDYLTAIGTDPCKVASGEQEAEDDKMHNRIRELSLALSRFARCYKRGGNDIIGYARKHTALIDWHKAFRLLEGTEYESLL